MPFIEVKTTEDLSAVAAELKSALGDAITAIPGKSESWLMVNLVGEQKMYFQGSDAPCALFSVPPERTYVRYREVDHWGYNNFNF